MKSTEDYLKDLDNFFDNLTESKEHIIRAKSIGGFSRKSTNTK
jgi:hypothetical protein